MNVVFFTGNVGNDAELRQTSAGEVLGFSVAVSQGFGRDANTEWYRCSIWGRRGANLQPHIKKGTKVVAIGSLKIEEYNDKKTFEVSVFEIDPFIGSGSKSDSGGKSGGGEFQKRKAEPNKWSDDLDDDVPF